MMKYVLHILTLTTVFSFSVHAEVNFTQHELKFANPRISGYITSDLDRDGDLEFYSWGEGVFKWYEKVGNEFIFNELQLDIDGWRSVFNVETPTLDFWAATFDDSGNLTVSILLESQNHVQTELFTVLAEENTDLVVRQGDFNGDRRPDYLVKEFIDVVVDGFYQVNFHYYYNRGNNQFLKKTATHKKFVHESSFDYGDSMIIDMNNDGRDDVVFYNHSGPDTGVIEYFKSTANNSYELITITDQYSYDESYELKFLANDVDGLIDVFKLEDSLLWYEQINDEFVLQQLDISSYRDDPQFFFEDFDADGDFDLITFPESGRRGLVKIHEFEQ